MATSTTPESINGKTARHTLGIHKARMAGLSAILNHDFDGLLAAWNDLNDHANQLIELEVAQRRFLEQLCRHRDSVREHANQIRVAS